MVNSVCQILHLDSFQNQIPELPFIPQHHFFMCVAVSTTHLQFSRMIAFFNAECGREADIQRLHWSASIRILGLPIKPLY